LVASGNRVVVVMEHRTKTGEAKLLRACNLPLTAEACVDRVITDMCVMDVVDGKFVVIELAEGVTFEDVKAATDAEVVAAPNIGPMKQ
jgi:3-oxoacid CoA-transferase subunit B